MKTGLDEIDLEAERVFGRTKQNWRIASRRSLQKEENQRTFDKLFKSEVSKCVKHSQ